MRTKRWLLLLVSPLFFTILPETHAIGEPPAFACGYGCDTGVNADADDTGVGVSRHVPGEHSGELAGFGGSASGSSCTNCEWAAVPACATSGQVGSANGDLCSTSVTGCPTGQVLYRVYFRQEPAAPWTVVGTQCVGQGRQPTLTANVATLAADFFRHMPLPAPDPSFQPADGAVVNQATIFSAGSPDGQQATFNLGGVAVTVSAAPAYWEWSFEPGVTMRFTTPGGPYPDKGVTYTYRSPGERMVTVTTVWTATYTGPTGTAAVDGVVSRTSAPMRVPVYEARSELVSP